MAHPQKQTWNELCRREQLALVVLGTVQIGLQVAALWDLWRRSGPDVRGPRWAWVAASFVSFAGPITYFTAGRRRATRAVPLVIAPAAS